MTYISRRTRIIVSRWTDECDADYILRAVRKRSDGRFKRHSSCDDLRAWVNDYCIKHEHLVDLMSDGEFSGRPPFRLYGRFIPVPVLFKLTQSMQNNDGVNNEKKSGGENRGVYLKEKSASDKFTCIDSSDLNVNENPNLERSVSSSRIQWEKNHLEKSLYDSTGLLSRALRTLERIDNIIDLAKEESENERNEEIQHAFHEAQLICDCNNFDDRRDSNISDSPHSSQSYVKKIQYATKCTELQRKISGLKEKLKKIKECRQLITWQICMTQAKETKCDSSNQVTELLSFQEQCHVKNLKRKLEKLISEKGRLLSELCDALNSLNNIKKSSKASLSQKKSSKTSQNEDAFGHGLRESASCACGWNCSRASSEFDKFNSDSPSGESYCNECVHNFKQMGPCDDTFRDSQRDFPPRTPSRTASSRKSSELVPGDDGAYSLRPYSKELRRKSLQDQLNSEEPCGARSQDSRSKQTTLKQQNFRKGAKTQNPNDVKKGAKEAKRLSKVSFADEDDSPCRKKYYQDDLSAFENSVSPQQQAVIQKALKKIESRRTQLFSAQETQKRPTSSPTTRRERSSVSFERHGHQGCERRVKSETTMQEIEKTLRNYEQRLRNYDTLEYKVEAIRQKLSEANRMKREWARQSDEGQREMEAQKEKSCKEITKLSSENRTLKKHMQQLMTKFETQCKKIQNLKTVAQKNWELECETEELKKELLKYQDTLEHQRKCITKWESVVALQRTEIENLMNHIRRLTMANKYSDECSTPERRNAQRSRSYSPEITTPKKVVNRPKTHAAAYRVSSSEEESEPCYWEEYEQLESRKRSQQINFEGDCYSSLSGRRMNR